MTPASAGPDARSFNPLFRDFVRHRDAKGNPRLGVFYKSWDRWDADEQAAIRVGGPLPRRASGRRHGLGSPPRRGVSMDTTRPPAAPRRSSASARSTGAAAGEFGSRGRARPPGARQPPDVALEAADASAPVFVYHALSERYPYASDRHHTFILEGARDAQRDLVARGLGTAFTWSDWPPGITPRPRPSGRAGGDRGCPGAAPDHLDHAPAGLRGDAGLGGGRVLPAPHAAVRAPAHPRLRLPEADGRGADASGRRGLGGRAGPSPRLHPGAVALRAGGPGQRGPRRPRGLP